MKIKLLLVEEHRLIRESLALYFNLEPVLEVVGKTHDPEEALKMCIQLQPDVIFTGINLKKYSGFDLVEKIKALSPVSEILCLSMYRSPLYAKILLQKGASGYVTKSSSMTELLKAVNEVYHGRKYISIDLRELIAHQMLGLHENGGIDELSMRELEIIELLKMGMRSKEIAGKLFISFKTVETHRYNILKKLKLKNTSALVQFVHQQKLSEFRLVGDTLI